MYKNNKFVFDVKEVENYCKRMIASKDYEEFAKAVRDAIMIGGYSTPIITNLIPSKYNELVESVEYCSGYIKHARRYMYYKPLAQKHYRLFQIQKQADLITEKGSQDAGMNLDV